jgi:hypothetical protein
MRHVRCLKEDFPETFSWSVNRAVKCRLGQAFLSGSSGISHPSPNPELDSRLRFLSLRAG